MKPGHLACAAAAAAAFVSFPLVALAENDGSWMVRARVIGVLPSEDADIVPIGGDTDIDDAYVPELDITYFFAKNWAAELILATAPHEVSHTPTGLDLGEVWLLPPTLLLQYHFQPDHQTFRPYLGVGVNYTLFYGVDDPAPLNVEYDDSFGFALQAGVDFPIGGGWAINADVKKIFINTDVTIVGAGPFIQADVDINPWVVGVGVGYRY